MAVTSDSECVKSASREATVVSSFFYCTLHSVQAISAAGLLGQRGTSGCRASFWLRGRVTRASATDADGRGKESRHPPRRSIFGMFSRRRWAAGSATAWEGGSRTSAFGQTKTGVKKDGQSATLRDPPRFHGSGDRGALRCPHHRPRLQGHVARASPASTR